MIEKMRKLRYEVACLARCADHEAFGNCADRVVGFRQSHDEIDHMIPCIQTMKSYAKTNGWHVSHVTQHSGRHNQGAPLLPTTARFVEIMLKAWGIRF